MYGTPIPTWVGKYPFHHKEDLCWYETSVPCWGDEDIKARFGRRNQWYWWFLSGSHKYILIAISGLVGVSDGRYHFSIPILSNLI